MSVYSIALFLHITGALGFFVVQGLEWIGLSQIRSAILPEEARALFGLIKKTDRLGAVSMLTLILTGIYMMLAAWRSAPWIFVVLGALVLEIVIFVAFSRPRIAAIEQALNTEERPVSKTFHTRVNHPILWISVYTRTAILLGIIFLKIAKPDLGGSLLTIGAAIALGLALALPVLRQERVQAGPVARITIAFVATAFVAVLALLAAKSISASTIPLSKTKPEVQNLQGKRSEVPTEPGSSNLSTQAPAASPETALREAPLLLQARCTQCHSLQTVLQAQKTRTEWEKTLSEMESFNAKISAPEKEVLLDYLTLANKP